MHLTKHWTSACHFRDHQSVQRVGFSQVVIGCTSRKAIANMTRAANPQFQWIINYDAHSRCHLEGILWYARLQTACGMFKSGLLAMIKCSICTLDMN